MISAVMQGVVLNTNNMHFNCKSAGAYDEVKSNDKNSIYIGLRGIYTSVICNAIVTYDGYHRFQWELRLLQIAESYNR